MLRSRRGVCLAQPRVWRVGLHAGPRRCLSCTPTPARTGSPAPSPGLSPASSPRCDGGLPRPEEHWGRAGVDGADRDLPCALALFLGAFLLSGCGWCSKPPQDVCLRDSLLWACSGTRQAPSPPKQIETPHLRINRADRCAAAPGWVFPEQGEKPGQPVAHLWKVF